MTIRGDERKVRKVGPAPKSKQDDTGPSRPNVPKPGGPNELIKRLRKVDPDQAKKYRQRSGQ
ncbi:MAG: ubiquitin-like protein UBact [Armatimonadetes bacterium]|jgi:hypothetical protein|uniref:Prokaryotic ubiquitin-like protein UBact n=1 Tax=Candidatus Nitrosymbiomonas proteolyticus TaxID=2608984 RepID=A0A809RUF0_9BACT|nr:MAG: hypothetical protein UZ18_ATM001000890 [Armatimonadetes bacterium OLB18]MBL1151315.1 ubiquitin-like protein UBact [Armatimonadota bacterium]MBV6490702.1 Prokaryotic ubiquitin-like protein UBact [Fimbriimonadaceae bacterium]QOJ10973.1 MAG: ubiquitin-like protein UBact [Chthonomonadaceae bacterium]BBO23412.1 conserved hypothetical protein [Candidatus Nitrosymbiomonas proteolyticus]